MHTWAHVQIAFVGYAHTYSCLSPQFHLYAEYFLVLVNVFLESNLRPSPLEHSQSHLRVFLVAVWGVKGGRLIALVTPQLLTPVFRSLLS